MNAAAFTDRSHWSERMNPSCVYTPPLVICSDSMFSAVRLIDLLSNSDLSASKVRS